MEGFSSFEQVVFIPGTTTGCLFTTNGEVLTTDNSGDSWHLGSFRGIQQMRLFEGGLTLLKENNQLLLVR